MPILSCSIPDCEADLYVRGYCRPHYRRMMKYGDPLGKPSEKPHNNCEVAGCDAKTRSKSSSLCMKHYHRKYRHGDVEAEYRTIKTAGPGRYRIIYSPGHPVSSKRGMVYLHRKMLFDTIGEGPHACIWCNREVTWGSNVGAPDNLCVDHLDGNKEHNVLSNLAPSCNRCNSGRASQERHEIVVSIGGWQGNDTIAALRKPEQRRADRIA